MKKGVRHIAHIAEAIKEHAEQLTKAEKEPNGDDCEFFDHMIEMLKSELFLLREGNEKTDGTFTRA